MALLLTLQFFTAVWAEAPARGHKKSSQVVSLQQLIRGVVKIVHEEGAVLSAATNGGHGSGFVIGEHDGHVLIFTNRHVIEGRELFVRSVSVEFNTEQRRPEVVDGEVIFVSPVHDFAVVSVEKSKLERAEVHPLPLPSRDSVFYDYLANERELRLHEVIAIGNPLDGSNITTKGEITGLHFNPVTGPFIQMQTPINPGNSGGPLISAETHEVVGINTAKYTHADATGFSIPIGVVLDEFLTWAKQVKAKATHTVGDPRALDLNLRMVDEAQLAAMGVRDAIEAAVPGYWANNYAALVVANDASKSGLHQGDVLLTLNGQLIGGMPYSLNRLALMSGPDGVFQVLRKGQVVEVHSPIRNLRYNLRRRAYDFVMISGMFVQQMDDSRRTSLRPDLTSSVVVTGLISTPDTNFMGRSMYPPPGSVITAVVFGDQEYPVTNLFELKRALNANRAAKMVQVRGYRANVIEGAHGQESVVLDRHEDTFMIPMREVITPLQFSLNKFMKQFSFDPLRWETRDFRDFVRKDRLPSSCEAALLARGA